VPNRPELSTPSILIVGADDDRVVELRAALADVPVMPAPATATSLLPALELLADVPFDLIVIDRVAAEQRAALLLRVLNRFAFTPHVVVVDAEVAAHRRAAAHVPALRMHYASVSSRGQTLAEQVRRLANPSPARRAPSGGDQTAVVPVGPSDVMWVKASGDYVRVHLRGGPALLVRASISALEAAWREHGFVRIHRAYLVAISSVIRVRSTANATLVTMPGGVELPVSRRRRAILRSHLPTPPPRRPSHPSGPEWRR
jgi:two-component system, LytTR family, response regulator LytT